MNKLTAKEKAIIAAKNGEGGGGEWTSTPELTDLQRAKFIVEHKDELVELGFDWERHGSFAQ